MIILLHGDHIEASRTELNRLKLLAKDKDIRDVDGRNVDEGALSQALESSSLFGGETFVIVERLFSKIGRQQKRIEALCTLLVANSKSSDIVLWEDKEVGASVIKNLGPGAKVQLFKFPVLIFQFLDGLRPGNAKNSLETYATLCQTEAPELVFSMMVKRVRQLIQLSDSTTPPGLADWQASRLTTQAKSFTMEKLVVMYRKLHDMEVSIKSGESPFTLAALVEQWIVSL